MPATINSAFWKVLSVFVGQKAQLEVSLSGIKKRTKIIFTVYDKSPSKGKTWELPAVFVEKGATSAKTEWTVEYFAEPNLTQGLPEYDFTAAFSPTGDSRATTLSLQIGFLDKPVWKAKDTTKTPQPPSDSRFTAFFTRTEPIDMSISTIGLQAFVFDFFIFAARDIPNPPAAEFVDAIRDVKVGPGGIAIAEWSLQRLNDYTKFFGRAFNFTYTFRLPDSKGGTFPDPKALPNNSMFVANQARNVGEPELTLIQKPSENTLAGENLIYKFRVKGATTAFPFELSIAPDAGATLESVEPNIITAPDQVVTVTLNTSAEEINDQAGELTAILIDQKASSAFAVVATLKVPIAYKGVNVELIYPPFLKKTQVDDIISMGKTSTITITIKRTPPAPVQVPVKITYELESPPESGIFRDQPLSKEDPAGDKTNFWLLPGTYTRGKIFRLRVFAFYKDKQRAMTEIEYQSFGFVSLAINSTIPTILIANTTYTLDLSIERGGAVDEVTPVFSVKLANGTPVNPDQYFRYFSLIQYSTQVVRFDSQKDPDTQFLTFTLVPTLEKAQLEISLDLDNLPPGVSKDPLLPLNFDLNP